MDRSVFNQYLSIHFNKTVSLENLTHLEGNLLQVVLLNQIKGGAFI